MSRTSCALAAVLLAIAALGGCAREDGVPPVAPADLEAEISEQMSEGFGVAPEVQCPGELAAEVGATVTCTIAASEDVVTALVVVATVTAVDTEERKVVFDIAVDTAQEEPVAPEESTPPPPTEG